MDRPIVLKGVVHGKTITLHEESGLPDGYAATLHLILTPEEAMRLAVGSWSDMTPEQIGSFENHMSEFLGRPFKMPSAGPS